MRQRINVGKAVTNPESEGVVTYIKEVRKKKILTPDQELTLFERFKNGDETASKEIIEANLRFVISVANHYHYGGVELGDLINEGNDGLIIAVSKFDPSRGFKFISYAVWWIRNAIQKYLREKHHIIHVPRAKQNELQKFAGLLALDKGVGSEAEGTYYDIIPDHHATVPDQRIINDAIKKSIALVIDRHAKNERMKDIVRMHYGFKDGSFWKLKSIASELGVSSERIRQEKEAFIKSVQGDPSSMYTLQQYLGHSICSLN